MVILAINHLKLSVNWPIDKNHLWHQATTLLYLGWVCSQGQVWEGQGMALAYTQILPQKKIYLKAFGHAQKKKKTHLVPSYPTFWIHLCMQQRLIDVPTLEHLHSPNKPLTSFYQVFESVPANTRPVFIIKIFGYKDPFPPRSFPFYCLEKL